MAEYAHIDSDGVVRSVFPFDGDIGTIVPPSGDAIIPLPDGHDVEAGDTIANGQIVERRRDAIARNAAAILEAGRRALDTNRTYLALSQPTQAQAIAQVAALTRQMQALIRLATSELDDISDTA